MEWALAVEHHLHEDAVVDPLEVELAWREGLWVVCAGAVVTRKTATTTWLQRRASNHEGRKGSPLRTLRVRLIGGMGVEWSQGFGFRGFATIPFCIWLGCSFVWAPRVQAVRCSELFLKPAPGLAQRHVHFHLLLATVDRDFHRVAGAMGVHDLG